MLKVRVIPCLDVKDGRVVKGVNFVDLVDAGDPVEQAKLYEPGTSDTCGRLSLQHQDVGGLLLATFTQLMMTAWRRAKKTRRRAKRRSKR